MDFALVAARFVHIAATMTLFGGLFFGAALAAASLAGALRPLLRLAPAAAGLALASAIAWGVLAARDMAGGEFDGETLWAALTETEFGQVWLGRLALLALVCALASRPGRGAALAAALALASLALVGHAAAQGGALGAAHRLNRAVHLLAAAGWLGGLPPFCLCLRLFARTPSRRDALAAMMRYSALGHFAVAAVLVTGALDVAMTLRAWPWPPSSLYRLGLDLKIACVAGMVALALVNRYVTAPRVQTTPGAGQALAAGAIAEVALGLATIALVSGFATTDPG